mmetsp:Transcript_41285/g.108850  ORF Transcript_41285/g.108850 Transcript_41285/m.108850 type:complete len:95 (-) Transcript_41285:7-291(-)
MHRARRVPAVLEVVTAVLGVEAMLDDVEHLDSLRETGIAGDMLDLPPHGRSPIGGFTTSSVEASTTVRWELHWGANMGRGLAGKLKIVRRALAS